MAVEATSDKVGGNFCQLLASNEIPDNNNQFDKIFTRLKCIKRVKSENQTFLTLGHLQGKKPSCAVLTSL